MEPKDPEAHMETSMLKERPLAIPTPWWEEKHDGL
jgi:hypothetical protein